MKTKLIAAALALGLALINITRTADITPAKARAIAKDAYTFAYPLVMNHRTMYARPRPSRGGNDS